MTTTLPKCHNPYASALDGLKLDNPVEAFFNFCKERESIRLKREQGLPRPWTQDEVFQRGRFLNVFREDDRGTRALFEFVDPVVKSGDIEKLVQALFFARWCNRDHTLKEISSDLLTEPDKLKKALENVTLPPWCNQTAYPVEVVTWKNVEFSRIDAATKLFHDIAPWLVKTIEASNRDVVKATHVIANELKMKNDFPVFMAVMDLAWFRPDLIDPASKVPTGIGAVAFLDRLEKFLGLDSHEETADKMIELQKVYWPDAKRPFQPIDIEYLSCECRKYYSYVNGTKAYEGKNIFKPGKSPMLPFEMPIDLKNKIQKTNIYVIAGGPCSGKTSLIQSLKNKGYQTIPETAEVLINEGLKAGIKVEDQRKDPLAWQMNLLKKDFELFDKLSKSTEVVFTDTSFIETVVFGARAGIEPGPGVESWMKTIRYGQVFFLQPIEDYKSSQVRMESQKLALELSEEIQKAYKDYGYELIAIPAMEVSDRCKIILKHVKK